MSEPAKEVMGMENPVTEAIDGSRERERSEGSGNQREREREESGEHEDCDVKLQRQGGEELQLLLFMRECSAGNLGFVFIER